jgi:hypothetical protein
MGHKKWSSPLAKSGRVAHWADSTQKVITTSSEKVIPYALRKSGRAPLKKSHTYTQNVAVYRPIPLFEPAQKAVSVYKTAHRLRRFAMCPFRRSQRCTVYCQDAMWFPFFIQTTETYHLPARSDDSSPMWEEMCLPLAGT